MDQEPLVIEEIETGAELIRLFGQSIPVKVAFWLKVSDTPNRFLYLASERIDDTNFDLAYREVVRLIGQIRSPYLDLFRVKVVNANAPFAQAAADINDRFPRPLATCLRGRTFGGVSVDDVYIYPSPLVPAAVATEALPHAF